MQHGLSSSASKRVTSSPVFARSSGTSWPVGGYRNCGKGGGAGGSDMNNRLTGGESGSFWGSRTCALDDTLYHVRGCFLLLLIVLGGVRTPPTPPPPPPPPPPDPPRFCHCGPLVVAQSAIRLLNRYTTGHPVAQPVVPLHYVMHPVDVEQRYVRLNNRTSGCSTGSRLCNDRTSCTIWGGTYTRAKHVRLVRLLVWRDALW